MNNKHALSALGILASGTLAACILLAGSVATNAQSVDFSNLTSQQRTGLQDEFRRFLLENPEVIIDALNDLEQRERQAQLELGREIVVDNRDRLFSDDDSWTGGNPDGDITVVEFLDYRCGYCRRSHPVVQELLETDPNIRLVVKEFPILGPESIFASRLAIAVLQLAGPDAYKRVHELLISYQGSYDFAVLDEAAEIADLDADLIREAMAGNSTAKVIESNYSLASDLNIRGTPAFIIEGQIAYGYLSLAEMQDRIKQERARLQ